MARADGHDKLIDEKSPHTGLTPFGDGLGDLNRFFIDLKAVAR